MTPFPPNAATLERHHDVTVPYTISRKTSFLDLPIEIRYMVYHYVIGPLNSATALTDPRPLINDQPQSSPLDPSHWLNEVDLSTFRPAPLLLSSPIIKSEMMLLLNSATLSIRGPNRTSIAHGIRTPGSRAVPSDPLSQAICPAARSFFAAPTNTEVHYLVTTDPFPIRIKLRSTAARVKVVELDRRWITTGPVYDFVRGFCRDYLQKPLQRSIRRRQGQGFAYPEMKLMVEQMQKFLPLHREAVRGRMREMGERLKARCVADTEMRDASEENGRLNHDGRTDGQEGNEGMEHDNPSDQEHDNLSDQDSDVIDEVH
ncbi:Splicing factor U2AF subunit [Sphaceloma murrayae]|uniref:Splicing factor U2AF subunit n=1 Tax=Sphaceloma murrayae TaxID=2082308 RepID=A0A2K1QU97_9PEZI|nr:Splicing factor U2AF subunit [Sphaceloma murrayae]